MALTDGVEVGGSELTHVVDASATIRLNGTSEGRVRITNKGNANATAIEAGDVVSLYRDSTLVFEGVAMAPIEHAHHPSVITANVLGYGGELARKNVRTPHSYSMEKGRTLTVADVIRGYPWQHGDGLFEDEPAAAGANGWYHSGSVTRSDAFIHSGDYSWKLDGTAAGASIAKRVYVESGVDKLKASVWVYPTSGGIQLAVRSGSTGTWQYDNSEGTGAWERLEATGTLAEGDTWFEVRVMASPVLTANGTNNMYGLYGTNASYSTARTEYSGVYTSSTFVVGQHLSDSDYYTYRGTPVFDLSSFEGYTITSATLKFTCTSDNSATDFDIQVRGFDESTLAADTTSYVAYGDTSFGSINSSDYSTDADGMEISLNASGISYLNDKKGGNCVLTLVSSRDMSETEPSGQERVTIASGEISTAAYKPHLIVICDNAPTGLAYTDDFTYCLHFTGDDDSVWDNGLLAGTGYSAADVSCAVELDGFDTRENTTVTQALRSLHTKAGEADYCWWFGPTAKALHFKAYPTATTTAATVGANVFSLRKRTDPTSIVNKVRIVTTSEEGDWYKLYTSTAGDAIQWIWQRGLDLIINVQNSSNSKMYVSHDNGATWTATKTFSASSTYAYRVQHDAVSDIVYLSTNAEGMFYSSDRGDNWSVLDANVHFGNYFQAVRPSTGVRYEFKMGDVSGSGKIYRREHGGSSWDDITPTISGVTNFYLPLVSGAVLCCEGFGGDGVTDKIVRCAEITKPIPEWTTEYTTSGNHNATTWANGLYGACTKVNGRTGQTDLYYAEFDNTPVARVLRSQDGGMTWAAVFTSSDADDYGPGEMDANDGIVYMVIRANDVIGSATKYGRVVSSSDDGETWATAVDGTSSVVYSYAVHADGNTILLARDVPDSGTSRGELLRRTDAYNLVVDVEDAASIAAYGEYAVTITDQTVQTRDVGERICQGVLDLYADPLESWDISLKLAAGITLGNTMAVTDPTGTFAIPATAQTVSAVTFRYPLSVMDVRLGKDYGDVGSALSALVERHIEGEATDEVGIAITAGTDDTPGIVKTPTGRLVRTRGTTAIGTNYVLSRLRKNGMSRADAW